MAASYEIFVNGGESRLDVSLSEGDYSPVTDADMPDLVWKLARAASELEGASTVTVQRTSPVTTAVLEV